MARAIGTGQFIGTRKHGMNEGPLLAYRDSVRQRMAEKRARDQARDVAAKNRSPKEQVARLDALLGKGQGAQRERARLSRLLKGK